MKAIKSLVAIIASLCFIIFFSSTFAQWIAFGPQSPNTFISNGGGTRPWNNPNLVKISNDFRADATAIIIGNISEYLQVTNFNFSIPTNSLICGIVVQVEKSATGLLQNVTDRTARLIKGGTLVGSNYALTGAWPYLIDSYLLYGGNMNLWGTTWTPAEINSPNFGFAISVDLGGIMVLPSARIDHIQITVYYELILPVHFIGFNLKSVNNQVHLDWTTATEENNKSFTIQRSLDAISWKNIETISGNGTTSSQQNYNFIDTHPLKGIIYYRIEQSDLDGTISYSSIQSIYVEKGSDVDLYMNAQTGQVYINVGDEKDIFTVKILNYLGQEIKTVNIHSDQPIDIDKTDQCYFFIIQTKDTVIAKKIAWQH